MLYQCNLPPVATFAQPIRRRSERRIAKVAIVVFVERENEREGCDAFTVDVSKEGARIKSGITLTPGEMVEVAPFNGSEPVTARVVWVGKPASELEGQAGLEFLDPFNISA
jgi:PilZ domain